jgi:membrane-bound serine protease (ClpP class)
MKDHEFDDDLDLDMDRRLAVFARSSREPALPDRVADLPWTVQQDMTKASLVEALSAAARGWAGFRRAALGTARLAVTLAVAGSFLLLVGQVRTRGEASAIVPPIATPRAADPLTAPAGPEVILVPTSGVVDDVMADHVSGAVNRAVSDGAGAIVIQLNTLGGSEQAMQRIAMTLEASKVPTIVWVGPGGAKAASAGTFITMSAGLAYMAQATNIGAASPVAANGQDIATVYGQTEADKTMSDAVAFMTGYAQRHHPKAVDWAVSTVSQARSYSADQALAAQAINGEAETLDQVLAQADGQIVPTPAGPATVHSRGATIVTINEDFIQSFLHALDDPNIAFILLVFGVLFIIIEFFHPTLLMGLVGALCLALSFYGSGSLPLNALGVVLVVMGIAMIVLEPSVPSHGLLTVAGISVFVVGGVAFYGSPGPYLPAESVAPPIIAVMAAAAGAYGLILVSTLLRMRMQPAPVGAGLVGVDKIVGQTGLVQASLSPVGTVYVGREAWSARMKDGTSAARGTQVRVIGQDGLILIVEEVGGN